VLRTRSPLIPGPKPGSPFDLHVLSAPPAFVLSQDQTLRRDSDLTRYPKASGSAVFRSELAGSRGTSIRPVRPPVAGRAFLGMSGPGHGEPNLGLTRHWHSHAVQFSRCERRTYPRAGKRTRTGSRADR
jgi:hypothetical protein